MSVFEYLLKASKSIHQSSIPPMSAAVGPNGTISHDLHLCSMQVTFFFTFSLFVSRMRKSTANQNHTQKAAQSISAPCCRSPRKKNQQKANSRTCMRKSKLCFSRQTWPILRLRSKTRGSVYLSGVCWTIFERVSKIILCSELFPCITSQNRSEYE